VNAVHGLDPIAGVADINLAGGGAMVFFDSRRLCSVVQ
jgi:hypothetical protein